jgi:putative transposase
MTVAVKREMVEPNHRELSIRRQCGLLGLSRSSYYRVPVEETEENVGLMRLIDEEYTRHPFYGTRQMRNYLVRLGYRVNRKRVQRLMRVMGLQSIAPRRRTSVPGAGHKVYPYLLRGLRIDSPDQVWASDITYIRLRRGFVFLTAVMDWHSRYVLSWEVSVTLEEGFCVSALERALRGARPEIFNTDQGAQFTGAAFTGVLEEHGVRISMDGKGRVTDNIMVERLWRTVKYEEIYLKEYDTVEDLVSALREYFEFYNHDRPHASLGGKTPAEIYRGAAVLERAA